MDISNARRTEQKKHTKELKNLTDSNKNEIDRQKLNHSINKANFQQASTLELNNLRSQNQYKTIAENDRNNKVLNELKESLSSVKVRTTNESNRIKKMFADKKDVDQKTFEGNFRARKDINQMAMQDLNHEKSVELQKIQREADAARTVQKSDLIYKRADDRDQMLTEISLDKDKYSQHKFSQDTKFRKALSSQNKENVMTLVNNERSHQDVLKNRTEYFKEQRVETEKIGLKQQKILQNNFEQKYQENYKNNEELLQKLSHHKERILEKLKGEIKNDLVHEVEKEKDTFYRRTEYKPTVTMNDDKSRYILSLKVPDFEAKKFNVVADGRELKLSMQRDFNFSKNENGNKSTISRVESSSERIKVDQILNGKDITKSYTDGILKFEIGLA
jgi:HSP20 family molecular chaperone IbpA